jgi:DNA-binding transcriptional regulator YiaG
MFIEEIENENLLNLYSKYKELAGFVTSKEITGFRKKYNISQRELGYILGFGKITINRYENGALQNQAHDDVLRNIIKNDAFFKEKVELAFVILQL